MITPVLICGGSGTRLWPLSRKSYPKQFGRVMGDESLFQAAAKRFQGSDFAAPVVITGEGFRFIVTEQLAACETEHAGLLIEPEGRNTAPAALAAALYLHKRDPDAMMLLVPADHAVPDAERFREVVHQGAVSAAEGQIVTFGIAPTRPETGYGWLEAGAATHPGVHALTRFIEKPDAAAAEQLFSDDRYLWNAGVFLAKASVMIEAFATHAPEIHRATTAAMQSLTPDLNFLRMDAELWSQIPEDSIDFAVMEKANNVSVVRFDGEWSDLGSWESVWQASPRDAQGNVLSDRASQVDCENTLLRSDSKGIELVGIGLRDIAAVAMGDAVVVTDMAQSQNVKQAVQILKARGAKQATEFPIDHRPWGWFETLALSKRFQVKRIHVHPGASLSLQSHVHRSEHWIVVQGTARVTVDDRVELVTENQSIYIPLGAKHRMENPGKLPMILIEVQTGSYLGEDDIIRFEDKYARS